MQQRIEELDVKTRYIAETLLPTRHGNFRLRGYKHSVRPLAQEGGRVLIDQLDTWRATAALGVRPLT